MTPPKRLLVTGSRDWMDFRTIEFKLWRVWEEWGRPGDAILIEGECPYGGVDKIARDVWASYGLTVEPYPAERAPNGRLLGPERNQRMVDSGADLCLAFPLLGSRGTWDCVKRARAAGIEVRVIRP